jgi:hypothetical protein
MRAVAVVAAEDLVAAVADERHLHVPPGRLAHEQLRQRRLVSERLVEHRREPRQQVRRRVDLELLVSRPPPLCHLARVGALVVAAVGEADGERPHRLRRGLSHHRDHDRRVDSAREQRPERHVGDEPAPDRRRHLLPDERVPVRTL